MKYSVDKNNGKAYIQLYKQIKKDIITGVYTFNTKLPSKRILSEETGVSVITVEHAYFLLCEEGYIDSKERSGYFVCYNPDSTFDSTIITTTIDKHSHTVAHNTDFPFSTYAKTVRKVLSQYGEYIFNQCNGSGCNELKNAICNYLKRSRGITVKAEQIVIGAGSEYLYGLIVQMLGKNRIYALEDPSYPKIAKVYRANGVKTVFLPLVKNGISSDHLQKTPATVLHITPYRSYPSRISANASKKREYIDWVKNSNKIIVEDDYESEFTLLKKAEETVFSLSNGNNVIYVNTFSKTVSPSIRIAYMIIPENMIPLYQEMVGFYSCSVPLFNQLILAEFIANGNFERHINKARRKARQNQ